MDEDVSKPPLPPPVVGRGFGVKQSGGSLLAMAGLCLIAIGAQATGLYSLVQFGAEREGWNAQKSQFANVQSEWNRLSQEFNGELEQQKVQKAALAAEIVKLDDDRRRLAEDLAKVKGQYDSIAESRDEAIALHRRAQQQQQAALDAEQAAQTRTAELNNQLTTIQRDIVQLKNEQVTLEKAVQVNRTTADQQKMVIAGQSQELAELDKRLVSGRDELRKQNADLLKASDELAKALAAKQAALAVVDEGERLTKAQDELASLTGQIAALKTEKGAIQTEFAKEEARLQNAKERLADYLEQWKTRDTITKQVTSLQADVARLTKERADIEGALETLRSEHANAQSAAEAKSKELSDVQKSLDELRKEEIRLGAVLLEKVKALKSAESPQGAGDEE
jgi:chromosome segregation ATPase